LRVQTGKNEDAGRGHTMFSSGISEMVLMVEDVRDAARFYEEVVGLAPEREADEE
jgi:predicted enzyme related to lactoylglutathione lyase